MADLELYYLPSGSQESPLSTQDVYNTVATQQNLGNNRISPSGIVSRNVVLGGKTFYLAPGEEGSIQRAINILNLKGGGTLHLTAGTYNISQTISSYSNIALVGDGAGLTFLDFLGTSSGLSIIGTNAYSTGTVSISNDSKTVTGSGTTWTSAMVGRSILLGELWYEITAFGSVTSLTIARGFSGATLSGSTYRIATVVSGVICKDFTLTNSTGTLFKLQDADFPVCSAISIDTGGVGFDADYISGLGYENCYIADCTTGATLDNCPFLTWFNTSIDSCTGTGLAINTSANSAVNIWSIQNCGSGMTLSNVTNTSFNGYSIKQTTAIGLELVGVNTYNSFTDGMIDGNGSDGVKVTATSDFNIFTSNNIQNNTGWGMNIAASSSDNNVVNGNTFTANTAGNLTDSGTSSVISANAGV